ncbi:hypothetical protein [Halosimplex salinum]|uniref:hypothetical protein n=1 Tax=Halosimplex salinum TaxID=1710538 RepID=UPI000F4A99B4|nr:hypothetical protein [Halosimplex salinum]
MYVSKDLIAFTLLEFFLYVYRRGLGASGRYRDPVFGMRTDVDGSMATHDGTTITSARGVASERAFVEMPGEFATRAPAADVPSDGHDHH